MNVTAEELQRISQRLRTALGLYPSGVAMKRAQLRREHPQADDEEIRRLIRAWLRSRPGAEFGDAEGKATIYEDAKP